METVPNLEAEKNRPRVVITGAASGIGRALKEAYQEDGGIVTAIDINYHQINFDPDSSLAEVRGDVTDHRRLEGIAGTLTDSSVDLLIIAAGTGNPKDEDDYMRINYQGAVNTFKAFSPKLSPNATVVFVSSDTFRINEMRDSSYAKSKRAMAEFATSMAEEHPDLRILTLLPGPVDTPLFRNGKSPEVIQRIDEEVGILDPQEFAEMLIEQILPDNKTYASGSWIRIYKKEGIEVVND